MSLQPAGKDRLVLIVTDDGVGLPTAIDPATSDSMGLHLVSLLATSQLGGTVDVSREGGTTVTVNFPLGLRNLSRLSP